MASVARGRFFRRRDGKYLLYIPKDLAEDSTSLFKGYPSVMVRISVKVGDKKLAIKKWEGKNEA